MRDPTRPSIVSPQSWIEARQREEEDALRVAMADETVRFPRITYFLRRTRIRRRIARESGHGPRRMY